MNLPKIRPAKELRELIDYIRSKSILYNGKCPSITKITKVIAEQIDKEQLWENEFNGK